MSKIWYSHCSPIVMVLVLISDDCCLDPCHKNWVLRNIKIRYSVSNCHGPCNWSPMAVVWIHATRIESWRISNIRYSHCSPIFMVLVLISDGCCLDPCHKNWVLGNVKKFDTVFPIVMVLVIDLRWLLFGSKPQELGLGECQKFDTVTVPRLSWSLYWYPMAVVCILATRIGSWGMSKIRYSVPRLSWFVHWSLMAVVCILATRIGSWGMSKIRYCVPRLSWSLYWSPSNKRTYTALTLLFSRITYLHHFNTTVLLLLLCFFFQLNQHLRRIID